MVHEEDMYVTLQIWSEIPIKITGMCSICTYPLTTKFPKGFPYDWRWCCGCLSLARHIIIEPDIYLRGREKNDESLFMRIYRKMTLVG